MKLGPRLVVAVLSATPIVILGLSWSDRVSRHASLRERLFDVATDMMEKERAACEAAPEAWGGGRMPPPPPSPDRPAPLQPPPEPPPESPGRGPRPPSGAGRATWEVFAYDASLRSRNADAPALDAEHAAEIEGRSLGADEVLWPTSVVEVLVEMPWEQGPCSRVLARSAIDRGAAPWWRDRRILGLGAIAAIVLGSVYVALRPVIRRIRDLTTAVRDFAKNAYLGTVVTKGNDEIAELSRAFDAAGREIREQLLENERREQTLRRFLSSTTHDVMIPLTVLQGHLSELRERAAEGSKDAEILVSAMHEAHYMASLVHNLAVAARLEAGEAALQHTRVDLGALVGRVVDRHAPIAKQLGISIEGADAPEPLFARADVTVLEQALSNLVHNAIRYNHRDGHVAVMVERAPGDRFRLRVLDDGPGISDNEISGILERGARGNDARTRAPEGQGLGLHIAYRAAALSGFSMKLANAEGGGFEATLSGPLAAAP